MDLQLGDLIVDKRLISTDSEGYILNLLKRKNAGSGKRFVESG